ncbi:MAG: hypothetical protein N3F66_11055 [Spirochaetes bacterium]|nr:hypothetical protein [Spirochaetota bacterium]
MSKKDYYSIEHTVLNPRVTVGKLHRRLVLKHTKEIQDDTLMEKHLKEFYGENTSKNMYFSKNKIKAYATCIHLHDSLYRVYSPPDAGPAEFIAGNVKCYLYNRDVTYPIVLLQPHRVMVCGEEKSLIVDDDAHTIDGRGTTVLIFGYHTITIWYYDDNRVIAIKRNQRITYGELLNDAGDIMIIADGNIYFGFKKINRIPIGKDFIQYHSLQNGIMLTTTGFIYRRKHINLGKPPQKVTYTNHTVIVLSDGQLYEISGNGNDFTITYYPYPYYIYDIAQVENTLYADDSEGLAILEFESK